MRMLATSQSNKKVQLIVYYQTNLASSLVKDAYLLCRSEISTCDSEELRALTCTLKIEAERKHSMSHREKDRVYHQEEGNLIMGMTEESLVEDALRVFETMYFFLPQQDGKYVPKQHCNNCGLLCAKCVPENEMWRLRSGLLRHLHCW